MINALTIDLEDWRQLIHMKITGELISPDTAVIGETEFALNILARHNVKATFFVLGNIAETFPNLIQRIDKAGHEIATHGLSHQLVYRQTPLEFRQEIRRAKALLETIVKKPIDGYRAPEFSITKESWWALNVLAEEGFKYDSSIYPIDGSRYGVPESPLQPHYINTDKNHTILEFPLTAIQQWGHRWPVAGGGYFRILPYWITKAAIDRINREGRPAVVYLHPYEIGNRALRMPFPSFSLKTWKIFTRYCVFHNLARSYLPRRLERLLCDFKFIPLGGLVTNG